jgi:hypothetical protein
MSHLVDSLGLDQRQLKQLELTRTRLYQLCNNLVNLTNTLDKEGAEGRSPLPDP